ncbi:zinc finger domain-containing protein [Candidatus Undinarchaeota archaeon]
MKCISCGTNTEAVKGSIEIKCPTCGKNIGRCGACRKIGVEYQCKCGFRGP